jgi:hypothetical protein
MPGLVFSIGVDSRVVVVLALRRDHGPCLLQRDPRLQPTNGDYRVEPASPQIASVLGERHPEIGGLPGGGDPSEGFRRHAYDRVDELGLPPQRELHLLPDDPGVRSEAPLPQAMAQHDGAVGRGAVVLSRDEGSAEQCRHPQHVEVVGEDRL